MIIPFVKSGITLCSTIDSNIPMFNDIGMKIDNQNIVEAVEVSNGWLLRDENRQQVIIGNDDFISLEKQISSLNIFRAKQDIKGLYEDSQKYGWFSYFPLSIELDITSKCNFNCIHCNRSANSTRSDELNFSIIKKIANEIHLLGVKRVQLLGGEPTIHPFFFDICAQLKEAGANDLFTSTNGWIITDKIKDLFYSTFSTVQVSLHSVTKERHDYITAKNNSWERAIDTIRVLVEHHVDVIISMSVMELNLHEMEDMIYLASNLGVKTVRFLALQEVGRGLKLSPLSQKQLSDAAIIIDNLRKTCLGTKILSAGFPTHLEQGNFCFLWGCAAGRTLMAIHANGEVSCCSIVKKTAGSIYNNSILEIWHNDYFRNLRKIENDDCQFARRCGGKCRYKYDDPYTTKC